MGSQTLTPGMTESSAPGRLLDEMYHPTIATILRDQESDHRTLRVGRYVFFSAGFVAEHHARGW